MKLLHAHSNVWTLFILNLKIFPECKAINGKKCVFPFKYKGTTYSQCTKVDTDNGVPWCATSVDHNGIVRNSQWSDCNDECQAATGLVSRSGIKFR